VLTIREQDLQSLAVIYGMEPDTLTAMLLHSGVLFVSGR
jgi:BldD-like DNA-binding protein